MKKGLKIVLGILFFIGFYSLSYSGEVVTSDINQDGDADGWAYITDGYVVKQEIDLNFDGKIDSVFMYDEGGKIKEEILDTNYDGKMDNWRLYDDGVMVVDRVDSNFDGRIDIWFYIDSGRVYKIEKDTTGDGKPDQVTNY